MAQELAPRVDGIPADAFRARFDACTTTLTERMDPVDYRSWSYYVDRAHVAYAMGETPVGIVEDLFLASRCLQGKAAVHLGRHEPQLFLTRRVHPLELALASGHPTLMGEIGEQYGLSLPLVMSRTDPELDKEVSLLTSHFALEYCPDYRALMGLGAIVFAGSLAALARGFDDEAALGLRAYGIAREGLVHREPPAHLLARLKRYDALNLTLVDIVNGDAGRIGPRIPKIVAAYEAGLAEQGDEDKANRPWLDLSAVAMLAAATLRDLKIELAPEHPYRGFVDIFSAGPRDDVLAEQAEIPRDVLAEMGIAVRPPPGGDEDSPAPAEPSKDAADE